MLNLIMVNQNSLSNNNICWNTNELHLWLMTNKAILSRYFTQLGQLVSCRQTVHGRSVSHLDLLLNDWTKVQILSQESEFLRCVGVERLPCVLFKDLMNCYFNFDGCKKDILLLSIRVVIYHVDIFLIIYVKNDNGVEIDSYNEKEISII